MYVYSNYPVIYQLLINVVKSDTYIVLTVVFYHAVGAVASFNVFGLTAQITDGLVEAVAVVAVGVANAAGFLIHLATLTGHSCTNKRNTERVRGRGVCL